MPDHAVEPDAAPRPFRPVPPLVIGLLGGIAAGKSTVAALFAAHGLCHVDADRHARTVADDPAVLAAVQQEFGAALVRDGRLDRQALAERVFRDAAARAKLEAITHPRIRAAIVAELRAALQQGQSVLLDVPLLLENGLIELCHATVYVDASEAVRRARARARGWSDEELQRRQAAQAALPAKRSAATFVVDNDGDLAATRQAIAEVLQRLTAG